MIQTSALPLTLAVALGLSLAAALGLPSAGPESARERASAEESLQDGPAKAFNDLLASQGLVLDRERSLLGMPVSVAIKNDLLEFLLVGPQGKGHESLLGTLATPSVVNAGLLALGAEPGEDASWVPPTEETEPELILPSGDGFYLYLAWREGEETYFYRVEDLITNVLSGRSMRRHKWVFLGSRFASAREGEPEVFVADQTHNLINMCFFYSKNTLLTAALPECQDQTIWVANGPLLPPPNHKLQLIFSKKRMRSLPEDWEAQLPLVVVEEPELDARGGR